MKICIISEREYGCGASIAAFRLSKALAGSGHEVHYVFSYPHPGAKSHYISKWHLSQNLPVWKRVMHKLLHHINPKIGQRYHLSHNYAELRDLLKIINPDVINLHNVGTILGHDDIISLGYSYPIIWTMHDLFAIKPYAYQFFTRSGKPTETVAIYSKLIDHQARKRMLVSKSNIQFVTPSKWMQSSLLPDVAGYKEIHLIPNGLSSQEFFPEDKIKAREHLGLSNNGFYLLFVASRLEYERKNIRVLLEALDLLQDSSIEVMAIGNAMQEFKNRYPFIRFFDPDFDSRDMHIFYSAADVFVITSLVDNLPNTVLESLFCGTPVVGANAGGIPEMVVTEKTGWLFDPRDPKELADIISSIHQQRELLSKITEKCTFWVREHFSIENQRDQYLQLFNSSLQ